MSLTNTRLGIVLDAMERSESSRQVQRLVAAFGGSHEQVRDLRIGDPALASRHLHFPGGGRVVLHDDTVVAVALPDGRSGLTEWVPGAAEASLDQFADLVGSRARFAGGASPYFIVAGAYLGLGFDGSWNAPGNLRSLTVRTAVPGLVCDPLDEDCPVCSDVLVRDGEDNVDVDATIGVLTTRVSSALLRQDPYRVPPTDLRPLHDSGLMDRVESQFSCTRCSRIICFTLVRGGPPTVEYCSYNEALRHPLEPVPPIESWADPERITAHEQSMRYLDHRPGEWFLAGRGEDLFLSARYSPVTVVDSSALIRLSAEEAADYRLRGRRALDELARRIESSGPYHPESEFHSRDLECGPAAKSLREEFSAAIAPHTWRAAESRAQR
ncbi:hypothetical protein ACF3NT_00775 [Naumannella halotolerans]|uniref:hypothetical protein n=1 Tax=Naumannella halotolerans TaxID=993414 RepID=UPI00370D4B69